MLRRLESVLDHFLQHMRGNRFAQDAVRLRFAHARCDVVDVPSGDEDDENVDRTRADFGDQLKTVGIAFEREIEQEEIGFFALDQFERAFRIAFAANHVETAGLAGFVEHEGEKAIVLDDGNPRYPVFGHEPFLPP